MSNPVDPHAADKLGFVLKPCPFCGRRVLKKASRVGLFVSTRCLYCGATGPERITGREADRDWNQRAEVQVNEREGRDYREGWDSRVRGALPTLGSLGSTGIPADPANVDDIHTTEAIQSQPAADIGIPISGTVDAKQAAQEPC